MSKRRAAKTETRTFPCGLVIARDNDGEIVISGDLKNGAVVDVEQANDISICLFGSDDGTPRVRGQGDEFAHMREVIAGGPYEGWIAKARNTMLNAANRFMAQHVARASAESHSDDDEVPRDTSLIQSLMNDAGALELMLSADKNRIL